MILKNIPISIKKKIPLVVRKNLRRLFIRNKWQGDNKVFCISMQRSGTTSVGDFFEYFGFPVAGHNLSYYNNWSKQMYNGDFESIFNSKDFLSFQVFQDDPWWSPDFYKVLYHRFPGAKFILMYRDSDDWFNSMLSHSEGKTLGNTKRHCKVYRREREYYKSCEENINFKLKENDIDNLLELKGLDNHYKAVYELHNREVIDFFKLNNPEALFHCDLYNKNKWYDLGKFIGINVPKGFKMHSHKTKIIGKK